MTMKDMQEKQVLNIKSFHNGHKFCFNCLKERYDDKECHIEEDNNFEK